MGTMPIVSDIILDQIANDGYCLSEAGMIRPQDLEFYFEVNVSLAKRFSCSGRGAS